MKKLSLFALVILFTLATMPSNAKQTVNAKKTKIVSSKDDPHLKKDDVNQLSKDHFLRDFGNLKNVTWKRTSDFDQATFRKNGKKMIAYYDDMSNLVGTTTTVKFSTLPENAQKEIKDTYKNYKIGAVIYFVDDENNETNMILYGIEFDDADNYFVELNNAENNIVLEVSPEGTVSFFKKL